MLSFAGRYGWVETDVDDVTSNIHTSERSRAFTGRAGIGYLFDNGLAPYLSYSTSFQPEAGTDFSGKAFDPATGEQWEAGIKYQPLGWNGLITASVFQITQQNVTTNDPLHHVVFNRHTEHRANPDRAYMNFDLAGGRADAMFHGILDQGLQDQAWNHPIMTFCGNIDAHDHTI